MVSCMRFACLRAAGLGGDDVAFVAPGTVGFAMLALRSLLPPVTLPFVMGDKPHTVSGSTKLLYLDHASCTHPVQFPTYMANLLILSLTHQVPGEFSLLLLANY